MAAAAAFSFRACFACCFFMRFASFAAFLLAWEDEHLPTARDAPIPRQPKPAGMAGEVLEHQGQSVDVQSIVAFFGSAVSFLSFLRFLSFLSLLLCLPFLPFLPFLAFFLFFPD